MSKIALCIGINDYPGTDADLAGCVNDAQDWAKLLAQRGFAVSLLLNGEATLAALRAGIADLIEDAAPGDSLVVTYSGHGTWRPDASGDEPDGRDEGLCPWDIGTAGPLLDDEMHGLFARRRDGVRLVLISDSCHSGSVTRGAAAHGDAGAPRPRFLPPATWLPALAQPRAGPRHGAIPARAPRRVGGDLLLAACQDNEYSWDTSFKGRPNGAFSHYAQKTLRDLPTGASYADWHAAIRDHLPAVAYPQTPRLFGSPAALQREALD
jgi:hypothetical protein